ncbi:MAG: Na+/H+ antiporter NhaC family protein [Culicoidibacterales bacterium]
MMELLLALLPPIVMLVLVFLTKRTLLSLGVGAVVAALILTGFQPIEAVSLIGTNVMSNFIEISETGWAMSSSVYNMMFIVLLAIMSIYININGGAHQFGRFAARRVKSRRSAQAVALIVGLLTFIDDTFSTQVTGQVAKNLTDTHGVSRAKLAYLVDTTSAPMAAIVPLSSWFAYILSALIAAGLAGASLFTIVEMVPMYFYPLIAVVIAGITVFFNVEWGPMLDAQVTAMQQDDETKMPETYDVVHNEKQTIWHLITPLVTLVSITFILFLLSGYTSLVAQQLPITLIDMLGEGAIGQALAIASAISLAVTVVMGLPQKHSKEQWLAGLQVGLKNGLAVVLILVFAWTTSGLIRDLEVGQQLAVFLNTIQMPSLFIPMILMMLSGFIAFATGTSWGTMAIMFPVAVGLASGNESLAIMYVTAVLSGAVFGDHNSIISDTTILSSSGSGCQNQAHFQTQLPYGLIGLGISAAAYLVLGMTQQVSLAWIVALIGLVGFAFVAQRASQRAGLNQTNPVQTNTTPVYE